MNNIDIKNMSDEQLVLLAQVKDESAIDELFNR